MMKTKVVIICLALIFSGMQVFAQMMKTEKKEWKKKAKEYSKNPAELKALVEAKQAAETDNTSLKGQVGTLNTEVSDKNAKIADLEDQISKMRGDLTSTKAELAQLKENPPAPVINPMDFSKGVVFKVQIGAFKNKDLAKYFDNNPNFGGEATDKGEQRFTIGVFRDYWDADKFKKYMREMGVKDAWIVPFKDGQRVEIKDVLEGVLAEKAEKSQGGK
jgi:TolA-binding protein